MGFDPSYKKLLLLNANKIEILIIIDLKIINFNLSLSKSGRKAYNIGLVIYLSIYYMAEINPNAQFISKAINLKNFF